MNKMSFANLKQVKIERVTDGAVQIDSILLEAAVWIPRSTLSMRTEGIIEQNVGGVIDVEVDSWVVLNKGLECLE